METGQTAVACRGAGLGSAQAGPQLGQPRAKLPQRPLRLGPGVYLRPEQLQHAVLSSQGRREFPMQLPRVRAL